MRYFFSRSTPPLDRIILIESGSRHLIEYLLPILREHWGPELRIDLVTCFAGAPKGLPDDARVWRVGDYQGPEARQRLYAELRERGHTMMGMLCCGEPIMTKWKWALALKTNAKVFIVNENCDYFWLDIGNWKTIKHFVLYRAGLSGANAATTIGRLLLFPFTILYLILFAAFVHLRRWWNLTRKAHI